MELHFALNEGAQSLEDVDSESYQQYMSRVNLLVARRQQLLRHLGGSEHKRWESVAAHNAASALRASEINSTILEPSLEKAFGLESPKSSKPI